MGSRLDEAQACVSFALRRATRSVTRAYDAALRTHGLRSTQFTILATLDVSGPQPTTVLAKALVIERTTLTRNLARLEQRGLVRTREGEDRRARIVSITPRGKAAAVRALGAWRKAQSSLRRAMGEHDFGALLERLQALTSV